MWLALFIIYVVLSALFAAHLAKKAEGFTAFAYVVVAYLWPVLVLHIILDYAFGVGGKVK